MSECFKYLFAHIDEVKAYFERLESMNDESVDLITTLKDTTSLTCLDSRHRQSHFPVFDHVLLLAGVQFLGS